jgi:iron(III) transport system permease protein
VGVATTEIAEVGEPRPSRPGRRPAPPLLVLFAAAAGALTSLPLVYLVIRSLGDGADSLFDTLGQEQTRRLLWATIKLTAAVTLASVALGVPLAWLTTRTDLPGRRVFAVLTALPLAVPSYVAGYTFVTTFRPRGLAADWLSPLGVERLPSLYGFWGAFLVLTFSTYPYVLLTVRAAIVGLDPALEEAARSLGRSPRSTFWSVVLPQLRTAIAAGGLLVALYSLHDFGAVNLLKYQSFTNAIYLQYQTSFDRGRGATLGLILVFITLIVLAAELRLRGKAGVARAQKKQAPIVPLGKWRWPALAGVVLVVACGVGVPVGVILYWLLRGGATESAGFVWDLARRSLEVSALGALTALVIAWPVAVLSARHPGRLSALIERATYMGYSLPGLVVALSLVFFGIRVVPDLYQTKTMLVMAYVILFLPQATGALRASLLQVSPSIEEAARSLGSAPRQVWRRVTLPLVRPGLLAGFGLVFLTSMKELPATLMLSPVEYDTLSKAVWSATNDALFSRAAGPALAIVLLSAIPLLLDARGRTSRVPRGGTVEPPV